MTTDVVLAVLTLAIGVLLVLRGYSTMRLAISLLGAFVGFALGGSVVAMQTHTSYLAGAAGWIGAILGGLVIGALAFSFYRVGITIGLGSLAYTVTLLLMRGFEVTDALVLRVVGLAAAVCLVIVAILLDLPGVIIVVATSITGAELVALGVRLLSGNLVVSELSAQDPTVGLTGFWWVLIGGVAALGIVVQYRQLAIRHASARAQWARP